MRPSAAELAAFRRLAPRKPRCCWNREGTRKLCYRTRRLAKKAALKHQHVYRCPLDRRHGWHVSSRREERRRAEKGGHARPGDSSDARTTRLMLASRDPRSANPQTHLEVVGIQISQTQCALGMLQLTKATSTVPGSASSTQLLAADSTRVGGTIVNVDSSKSLWLAFNGAVAVDGQGQRVLPNGSYLLSESQVAGQVNGIWDAGVTGSASVTAFTA